MGAYLFHASFTPLSSVCFSPLQRDICFAKSMYRLYYYYKVDLK
uniref:Uncharacterized protein n=1 Tax=Anguilla anguilla TaxID=7936 RepID=A0A0E9VQ79_ANGAN